VVAIKQELLNTIRFETVTRSRFRLTFRFSVWFDFQFGTSVLFTAYSSHFGSVTYMGLYLGLVDELLRGHGDEPEVGLVRDHVADELPGGVGARGQAVQL